MIRISPDWAEERNRFIAANAELGLLAVRQGYALRVLHGAATEALHASKALHALKESVTPEEAAPALDVNAWVRDLRAAEGRASEATRALRAALDEGEEEAKAAEAAHQQLVAERDEARARLNALTLAVSDRAEALRRIPAATLRAHLAERGWELAGRQNTLDGSPMPEHWHWTKTMPEGIFASRLDVILCDGATTVWGSVATVGEIEERAPELVLAELLLRAGGGKLEVAHPMAGAVNAASPTPAPADLAAAIEALKPLASRAYRSITVAEGDDRAAHFAAPIHPDYDADNSEAPRLVLALDLGGMQFDGEPPTPWQASVEYGGDLGIIPVIAGNACATPVEALVSLRESMEADGSDDSADDEGSDD